MLKDKAILVVEDNVFLALDLCSTIEGLQGRVVGPFATAAEALPVLRSEEITAAVIDCDLVDVEVSQIVMHLSKQAIPVVIHTASGPPPAVTRTLPAAPVLLEPVQTKILVARLAEEIAKRTGGKKQDCVWDR